MANDSNRSVANVAAFIESVPVPDALEISALGEPLNLVPPQFDVTKDQTITVGSQLAGFSASVSPELRPHISNAFLLAQLAANKQLADHGGTSLDWYKSYINVLTNIGWNVEGDASTTREVKGTAVEVHKEVIPIITAALGPAVAVASTIIAVLNGLAAMDKESPWITLFSRESQRASANQFQISYATVEGGMPRMTLVGFDLKAQHSVTQVLFFKFKGSEATLKHFEMKLSVNETIFDGVKDKLKAKIASFVNDFISDIEI